MPARTFPLIFLQTRSAIYKQSFNCIFNGSQGGIMRMMPMPGRKQSIADARQPRFSSARFYLLPRATLAFTAGFVGCGHVNGGVKTHFFLARTDLPGFSNWLSLLILPVLGALAPCRVRVMAASGVAHYPRFSPSYRVAD